MTKKHLLFTLIVMALVCMLAVSVSAEIAYVNSNGEQVSADDADIAYEIEIGNDPWHSGGNCRVSYIYLHDTSVTKIVIPEIELVHPSNGKTYKLAEYSYVRLSTGWGSTLSVYALDDKETKSNSLHAQIKELEIHIPVLGDGAGSQGNLAGWSGLEKLSFFSRAYEPQNKGGFLSGCTSIKEIHFYGKNNELSGNFFPSTIVAGGKLVFHENATGVIRGTAMEGFNGKDVTVYLNNLMQPQDATDPRLTWNKKGNLKFVLLVNDATIYTPEQIASYETFWMAGNNKNDNNAKYSMPIQTYCEFYGEHMDMQTLSPCASKCLVCNKIAVPENAVHNTTETIKYTSFLEKGQRIVSCHNDGCTYSVTEEVSALFTYRGYSYTEEAIGGTYSMTQSFAVNREALDAYKVFSPDLAYGVVASGYNNPLDESVDQSKVIKWDGEKFQFNHFQIKVSGITEDKMDTAVVFCAYVIDGGKTYYLSNNETSEDVAGVTYNSLLPKA